VSNGQTWILLIEVGLVAVASLIYIVKSIR